jgi:hypothetical protein
MKRLTLSKAAYILFPQKTLIFLQNHDNFPPPKYYIASGIERKMKNEKSIFNKCSFSNSINPGMQ